LATTSRAILRQRLQELFGEYFSSTTTGAGTSTTIVDTGLKNLTGGADNNFCEGWYVLVTSGAQSGVSRRVSLAGSGYVASTTIITVDQAWAGAPGNGVTYELTRVDPALLHNAINRAAEELFPLVYLPIFDETLVIDQLLLNGDMESAISGNAIPNWTAVNAPTIAADINSYLHGTQSAKITSGVSAGQVYQAVTNPVLQQFGTSGKSLYFQGFVLATAASYARLGISFDGGSTFTYSGYHSGGTGWELLKVSAIIPSTLGSNAIRVYMEAAATPGYGWFDSLCAYVGPIFKYTVPSSLLLGPYEVMMQYDENDPRGAYYVIPRWGSPIPGRRLRLTGKNTLSTVSSDTATIEVGVPAQNLLIYRAALILYNTLGAGVSSQERYRYELIAPIWEKEYTRLLQGAGARSRRMSAEMPEGVWHVGEDSSGRYLWFDMAR